MEAARPLAEVKKHFFVRYIMEHVFRLTNAESRLAELLWINAPITSLKMIKLAEQEFGWKKSATSTILKLLIDKGLARNEKSQVTMLYAHNEVVVEQSNRDAVDTGGCSLPMFIVSFKSKKGEEKS